MSNHIHLIASSSNNDLSGTIRDLKKYTTKQIIESIKTTSESRKEWLLKAFNHQGNRNIKNSQFQIWQQRSHPIELFSNSFFEQKLDYIHNNPVVEEIVKEPHHFLYSSAVDYTGDSGLVKIELI